jgi:hypothetical protein
MKRLLLFASGVACGLAVSLALAPASAQISPPATLGSTTGRVDADPTGRSYEYEVVTLKPVGRHPEELAELLAERGQAGWQLQTLTQVSDLAVFMRVR